jgi:predicted DCC family thiol-disulfide oxidoreductase YuxK
MADAAMRLYGWRDDPAVPDFPDDRPIIVFDGYCAFCSGWARFIQRRDKQRRFRLLAAQSRLGEALFAHLGLDPTELATSILIADGRAFLKSEGIIRIFEGIGLPWSLVRIWRVMPTAWRDRQYDFIARNRFRFGRREQCLMPQPGDEDRFLA